MRTGVRTPLHGLQNSTALLQTHFAILPTSVGSTAVRIRCDRPEEGVRTPSQGSHARASRTPAPAADHPDPTSYLLPILLLTNPIGVTRVRGSGAGGGAHGANAPEKRVRSRKNSVRPARRGGAHPFAGLARARLSHADDHPDPTSYLLPILLLSNPIGVTRVRGGGRGGAGGAHDANAPEKRVRTVILRALCEPSRLARDRVHPSAKGPH